MINRRSPVSGGTWIGRWIMSVPFLLAGMNFGGCAEKSAGPTVLLAKPQYYVVDLPVPDKFELDGRKSNHTFTAGHRSIQHYYVGSASQLAVNNFYIQRMPEMQWELIDQKLKNGVYHINYKKNEETCEIRIESTPGGAWGGSKTQICATIQRNQ